MTLEVRKAVQNRSIEILSAGNKAQQVPVISQFLKYFLLAITGSDPTADNYRDGYLQTSELFLYLGTKVKDATNGDEPKYGHLKEKWENGGFVFELPWAGKTMPGTPPGISETPTGSKTKVLKSPYISDMVLVEGGTFTMGSNEGQENEKPPHPVTLSDYYICMKEITQKEWRNIMGASTSLSNPSYNKGCDDCPVEQVNWLDVQEFINKLNEKTNLTYRLPTEAEWEYAARGGKYSKGNEYSGGNMIVDVAWCSDNSGGKTHPVGKKRPNELGIYDMSGNVYEWCYDWYDANFYANNKKTKDPCNTTASQYRVIRGGSWGTGPDYCRVAYRLGNTPDGRYDPVGFRLVLVP